MNRQKKLFQQVIGITLILSLLAGCGKKPTPISITNTQTPTNTPTLTPTNTATSEPISIPTEVPADSPTSTPTLIPTDSPTQPSSDLADIATPLDQTVSTDLASATEFLYQGDNPVQIGMEPDTIVAVRAAVIRGQVLSLHRRRRQTHALAGRTQYCA